MSFRGSQIITLDSKYRLAIPGRYRNLLRENNSLSLVLTVSPLEAALWIYPLEQWEELDAHLDRLSDANIYHRNAKQLLRGNAIDCRCDGNGRVLLSQPLREHAELGKQAMCLGQGNKLEIWSLERWNEKRRSWLEEVHSRNEEIMEYLGQVPF